MSMGYQVAVTPLQMAAAASAVANGGTLYEPHVVRAIIKGSQRTAVAPKAVGQAIFPETAATLTDIMEKVVTDGTGRRSSLVSVRPVSVSGSDFGTGQRNRPSCTSTAAMVRPTAWGAMPRRVVSTSGSSGIGIG
jgi:stage V sporulation protein D (sporulation-specific penicillin-binding protein)